MTFNVRFENSIFIIEFETENAKLIIDEFWRNDGFGVKIFAPETAECVVIATAMARKLHLSGKVESIIANSNIRDDTKAEAIKLLLLESFEDELEELG